MRVQVKEDLCSEFCGASCEVVGELTANHLAWIVTIWSGEDVTGLEWTPVECPHQIGKLVLTGTIIREHARNDRRLQGVVGVRP
jgi:hypothetical protein